MSPEVTVIIALARTKPSESDKERARSHVATGIDWDELRLVAQQWSVEPVVAMNLRIHVSDIVSADRQKWFNEWEQGARAAALAQALVLSRIAVAMGKAEIPMLAFKGPALALAAYNDFSLRTSVDIDVVIKTRDLPAAADVLRPLGYEPGFAPAMTSRLINGGHALEFYGENSQVELHSDLLPRHLSLHFSESDVWGSSHYIACMGSAIRTPSPALHFLYLCAHGAKHMWRMPRWTCDISELGERLTDAEVETVIRLAARYRARRLLALGLHVVRETFGDWRLPFPVEALGREDETRALVQVARRELDTGNAGHSPRASMPVSRIHPYAGPLWYWLQCRESWSDRVTGLVRFALVPAPDDPGGIFAGPLRPVRSALRSFRRSRERRRSGIRPS